MSEHHRIGSDSLPYYLRYSDRCIEHLRSLQNWWPNGALSNVVAANRSDSIAHRPSNRDWPPFCTHLVCTSLVPPVGTWFPPSFCRQLAEHNQSQAFHKQIRRSSHYLRHPQTLTVNVKVKIFGSPKITRYRSRNKTYFFSTQCSSLPCFSQFYNGTRLNTTHRFQVRIMENINPGCHGYDNRRLHRLGNPGLIAHD